MENIWIWILVGLLLWQGMTLLQFILFLYYKFRLPEFRLCDKEEIDMRVQKIISSHESYLLGKGFVFKYAVMHESMVVGSALMIHRFYYYHEAEGAHAMLETTPYKGALQSVRISYETVYESGHICVTENGMLHHLPVAPEEIYFFDHYLADWKEIYAMHLQDRIIASETITKQPFDAEGWLAYMEYMEDLIVKATTKRGLTKITPEGYEYRVSIPLWRFAKTMQRGYRKFAKILREIIIE